MAFKIIPNPEFTIDVAVPIPGGGEQKLTTTFRPVSDADFDGFDVVTRDGAKEALRAMVVAFHDVEIGSGMVLERVDRESENEAFEELLSSPAVRVAVNNAYHYEMAGVGKGRRGN